MKLKSFLFYSLIALPVIYILAMWISAYNHSRQFAPCVSGDGDGTGRFGGGCIQAAERYEFNAPVAGTITMLFIICIVLIFKYFYARYNAPINDQGITINNGLETKY